MYYLYDIKLFNMQEKSLLNMQEMPKHFVFAEGDNLFKKRGLSAVNYSITQPCLVKSV